MYGYIIATNDVGHAYMVPFHEAITELQSHLRHVTGVSLGIHEDQTAELARGVSKSCNLREIPLGAQTSIVQETAFELAKKPDPTSSLPSNEPAQVKVDDGMEDNSSYYGYLYEANKTPTKIFNALLRAIGQYIVSPLLFPSAMDGVNNYQELAQ